MATIRRYRDYKKDFVIAFELSNDEKFFIGKNGLVKIEPNEGITFDNFKNNAKLYDYKSARSVTSKLWNRRIFRDLFTDCNVHLIRSSNYPLSHIKKYCYSKFEFINLL